MEDNKFVRDLKEGVSRRKLPVKEDLGPGYTSPFEESTTPNSELPSDEKTEDLSEEEITENKKELSEEERKEKQTENKKDILAKVKELHREGKTIDEIYSTLKEQGYSYQSIEGAVLELVKEEKQSRQEERIEEPKKFEVPKEKISLEENPSTEPKSTEESEEKGDFAPLFIRVGKYRETIKTLQNLENYLNGMAKLFNLVNRLEEIRGNNINTLNKMYKKASETASTLSSGLLKPRGMKLEGGKESRAEMDELNKIISNLNTELGTLKEEVDKIKVLE